MSPFVALQYLLPHRLLSSIALRIARIEAPWFKNAMIRFIANKFGVDWSEAASADLILSVCDITSPELLEQRAVTERLLEELGVEGTPVITVLNKCDAAPDAQNEPYKGCVRISAKTGYGLPRLLQTIAEALPP